MGTQTGILPVVTRLVSFQCARALLAEIPLSYLPLVLSTDGLRESLELLQETLDREVRLLPFPLLTVRVYRHRYSSAFFIHQQCGNSLPEIGQTPLMPAAEGLSDLLVMAN
jgi:hypothetical protein